MEKDAIVLKLSIVIPAYNEAESLPETIRLLYQELKSAGINHEILVVNDNSKDNTLEVLENLKQEADSLRWVTNIGLNGFGTTVLKKRFKTFLRMG